MNYERVAAGLQKRLADTVSRYEGDLALLQEQATQEIERLTEENESLKTENESLKAQLGEGDKGDEVVEEEVPAVSGK